MTMAVENSVKNTSVEYEGDLNRLTGSFNRLRQFSQSRSKIPDYAQRLTQLKQLEKQILLSSEQIARAINQDFSGRAYAESVLLEVFGLIDELRFIAKHLKSWMKKKRVSTNLLFRPGRSYIIHQPLGLVGIYGAFNYPFLLTLSPLVAAIAAGNRVILKPSELTPNTAQVITQILSKVFSEDEVVVIGGDKTVGQAMSKLPFDHIFFTGSEQVGKQILIAAAENLTPVTLELGGKSPAILGQDSDVKKAAKAICYGKFLNAGQTCVAPDYVFLPESQLAQFVEEAQKSIKKMFPKIKGNADYTSMINQSSKQRMFDWLKQARDSGATIKEVEPLSDFDSEEISQIPPTLVWGANRDATLLEQEIFGPILPIITYSDLSEVMRELNQQERPLAMYFFDRSNREIDNTIQATLSGGVTINGCVYHVGQHHLPFGGVGKSGMGRYHGFYGFETFSHKRSVFVTSNLMNMKLIQPPYSKTIEWMLGTLLKKRPFRLPIHDWPWKYAQSKARKN